MTDLDLVGKRVLIRQDLNVPILDGKVTSDTRIRASLPTIEYARKTGAKVIVMSHLGRPTEGQFTDEFSLLPVARNLTEKLGSSIELIRDYPPDLSYLANGQVVLLENVRFNEGEKRDDEELSRQYASLCDVYVMDAFGAAHRAQASTHGVARFAPIACAGPLLMAELEALGKALNNPTRPMIAIVGGSKVSTKLGVLHSLSDIVDQLIPGGGIANTFVAAAGHEVGQSLYEQNFIEQAKGLMAAARDKGGDIPIPSDVVVGADFSESTSAVIKPVDQVSMGEMILDIGPETVQRYTSILRTAGTIVWNGPVGVFEFEQFSQGTSSIAHAVADSAAFSIAGGGDTLAAVDRYGVADGISYISTGGGAFLEFLEGKQLPAVRILEERSVEFKV